MLIIERIIEEALERDASDIHLLPFLKPILRIHKSLMESEDIEEPMDIDALYDIYDYIVNGDVYKDETYKSTRKLDTALAYKDIRLRVNVSFTDEIPVFTMRIIPNTLPTYEELGLPDIIRRMTYQPQGLMLVTGKTNSGKTTTLNALIDEINQKQNKKILTLEAPVEYKHTSNKSIIVQKEVGRGKDCLSFHDGVKNALREDCDILVIGEIRDKETMQAGIEMAESGHLVIGTLHTKSCAETIDRMINFYEIKEQAAIKYLIASLLKLVVSQRLIKNAAEDGLVLVQEIMVVNNAVAAAIRKEKFSVAEIEDSIQATLELGSKGLVNSLAELYVEGQITLDQAKVQIDEKNHETLNRTIMQVKQKKANG